MMNTNTKKLIKEALADAISYPEFRDLTIRLLSEGKTTGDNHSEAYLHYTNMNLTRMKRLEKTTEISTELRDTLASVEEKTIWLILVEAWCGDVAQNVPTIHQMAELNPNISVRLALRDEHPELMDQFLTDGGKGIPKLIALRASDLKLLGEWGPRPEPAQQMVRDYKALEEKPPYMEFVVEVQKWYAADKTETLQQEFSRLIPAWELHANEAAVS